MSLSLRLAIAFASATTLILCLVSALIDSQLTLQLRDKDETELRQTLGIQLGILRSLETERGPDLWQEEWAEHVQRDNRLRMRVLAPDGHVFSELPGADIPSAKFPAASGGREFARYEDRNGKEPAYYLLGTRQVQALPGRIWTVQGAFDLSHSRELLRQFRRRLLGVLVLAVALAAIVGWWVARTGLAPLREMSTAIAGIGADRLHARIGNPHWPSDLRALAENFDGLLGRLQDAFEQLSRFSSDLAHEFRTPITSLVAAASVMLARERTVPEYQETLGVMIEEGDRLSRMVAAMLFLARAENATETLHKDRIAARDALRELADTFGPSAEEHGVQIVVEGQATVLADAGLLRRALSNLISNSLRHTPRGGRIVLSARQLEKAVELGVADTGAGIAAEHLPHVFERFYRADLARSSGDSTGLGLSVVQSIIQLHGGEVAIRSEPGKGTNVTLLLPSGQQSPIL
ncbi:MAG: Sensor protein irlS [Ramlibacter sp.]|nr:Sensor protein irlS [Ramlibacter sp.]